jgi:hypothetical protein
VQEQTPAPEAITVELRANEKAATKSGNGEALPSFDGHIYSDAAGKFPAQLNDWEQEVVTTELKRRSFVAWYRNPQRATPNSLPSLQVQESKTLPLSAPRATNKNPIAAGRV